MEWSGAKQTKDVNICISMALSRSGSVEYRNNSAFTSDLNGCAALIGIHGDIVDDAILGGEYCTRKPHRVNRRTRRLPSVDYQISVNERRAMFLA